MYVSKYAHIVMGCDMIIQEKPNVAVLFCNRLECASKSTDSSPRHATTISPTMKLILVKISMHEWIVKLLLIQHEMKATFPISHRVLRPRSGLTRRKMMSRFDADLHLGNGSNNNNLLQCDTQVCWMSMYCILLLWLDLDIRQGKQEKAEI